MKKVKRMKIMRIMKIMKAMRIIKAMKTMRKMKIKIENQIIFDIIVLIIPFHFCEIVYFYFEK
jgi:hypothetical protein